MKMKTSVNGEEQKRESNRGVWLAVQTKLKAGRVATRESERTFGCGSQDEAEGGKNREKRESDDAFGRGR